MIIRYKVRCLRWTTSLRSTQRWCGSSTRPNKHTRISGHYAPRFQLIRSFFCSHWAMPPALFISENNNQIHSPTKLLLPKISVKTDFGETKRSIKKTKSKKMLVNKNDSTKLLVKKIGQEFFWSTSYFGQNIFLLVKQTVGRPRPPPCQL